MVHIKLIHTHTHTPAPHSRRDTLETFDSITDKSRVHPNFISREYFIRTSKLVISDKGIGMEEREKLFSEEASASHEKWSKSAGKSTQ